MSILVLNNYKNMASSQNVSFAKKEKASKKTEQKNLSADKIVTVIDEEVKNKSNRVAFAVGGSVLGVTALATVLNPRTFNKLVPKLRLWAQGIKFKNRKHEHAVHFRKFSEKVVKTAEKAATFLEIGNNLNSAKDLYVKRFCVQKHSFEWIKKEKPRSIMQKFDNIFTDLLTKGHNAITRIFDNIGKNTVKSSYKNAVKRMDTLDDLIKRYAERLNPEEQKLLQQKLAQLVKSRQNFTPDSISTRLKQQEARMSELEQKTHEKIQAYLQETVQASKNYKKGGKEQLRENIKDTTNFWARDILQPQKDVVMQEGKKMTDEVIGEKGLYDEIFGILESHISVDEKNALQKGLKKVRKTLQKANDNECIEYFDKKRDLILGSAPTDVVSNLGVLALGGLAIGTAKDKDAKITRTLTMVAPAFAGVCTSLAMTAKLYSGVKGIIVGGIAGTIFSLTGSVINRMVVGDTKDEEISQKQNRSEKENKEQVNV